MIDHRTPKRIILRRSRDSYPQICAYLMECLGFLDRAPRAEDRGFPSKWQHIASIFSDIPHVLSVIREVEKSTVVVSFGYISITYMITAKLLGIRARRFFYVSLFIHSSRWLFPAKVMLRLFGGTDTHYVLFSQYEKALYAELLGLDAQRLHCLPYGDWSKGMVNAPLRSTCGDYFFSGGYSNRDYAGLVSVFRGLDACLVIVCGQHNADVPEGSLPANIQVIRSLSSEAFDSYAANARACILPLREDTGAAGQSCLLRYMRFRKIVIASNTHVVQEYIEHGVSGILVANLREELGEILRSIAAKPDQYDSLAEGAYRTYVERFTYPVVSKVLREIILES